eukprot:1968011-Rhodomonas_salina.1
MYSTGSVQISCADVAAIGAAVIAGEVTEFLGVTIVYILPVVFFSIMVCARPGLPARAYCAMPGADFGTSKQLALIWTIPKKWFPEDPGHLAGFGLARLGSQKADAPPAPSAPMVCSPPLLLLFTYYSKHVAPPPFHLLCDNMLLVRDTQSGAGLVTFNSRASTCLRLSSAILVTQIPRDITRESPIWEDGEARYPT